MGFLDDLVDEKRSHLCIEQGTPEWFNMRLGRFTSSEMHKLMKPGKRPMTKEELAQRPKKGKGSATTTVDDWTVFSDTALTYIEQKVAEILTGQIEDDVYAYAKEYGKEMEPVAAEYFSELTGLSVEPAPFIPFGDHAGGSPDRFIIEEDAGLEIKCPLKPVKQVKYLQLTDQFDLMRFFPDFYWQCESNLLFTGKQKWYFATFCPQMKIANHKLKIIEVKPIAEHFQMITDSIAGAVGEKLRILKDLQ
jgi:hypothetical protein